MTDRKIVQLACALDNDGNETVLALAADGTAWRLVDYRHVVRAADGKQAAISEWRKQWEALPALPADHGRLTRVAP